MWPRIIELMLGFWLVVSPFIFQHSADQRALWTHDVAAGAGIAILALLSFWKPLRHAHLVTVALSGWLFYFGYQASAGAGLPAHQNHMVLGLLLLMLAIIPNEANSPPEHWRERTP